MKHNNGLPWDELRVAANVIANAAVDVHCPVATFVELTSAVGVSRSLRKMSIDP